MRELVEKMYAEVANAKRNAGKEREIGGINVELVARARIALNSGNCRLRFEKADGEIVDTIATTRSDVVSHNVKTKGNRHSVVTPFLDLKELRWRSFRWDRLISCELV